MNLELTSDEPLVRTKIRMIAEWGANYTRCVSEDTRNDAKSEVVDLHEDNLNERARIPAKTQ